MAAIEAGRKGEKGAGLISRIADDPAFASVRATVAQALDPARYIGRAPEQVEEYFREELKPRLSPAEISRAGPEDTWELDV